ncbi:hypothetical protein DAEQUDRAFT_723741 [Daedalea quercina L-15889]|uniref:Uncharacterized protein n=1 Tax=Daedalea quercina L-15889 TaxID=1314783 RepID=A0A165S8W8_9APHY|nr:hypothetical protein DAEQUDRAFT_723741 [Daedalea quercina L-15889]
MSKFGNINPCRDKVFKLTEYNLAGVKFDAFPKEIKTHVSTFVLMDPRLVGDPSRIVAQRVAMKHRLLSDLLALDDSVRTRRNAVNINPFEMGKMSFLRWWQGALRQQAIVQIMQQDLRSRNALVASFVERVDALLWLETSGYASSPTWDLDEVRQFRNEVLGPVVEATNRSLMFLGEYILSPSEDAKLDGDMILCESVDREEY